MKGCKEFNDETAAAIRKLISEKLTANSVQQKQIRDRIRKLGFYASDFNLGGGYTIRDFDSVVTIMNDDSNKVETGLVVKIDNTSPKTSRLYSKTRDEHYIINLCDELLSERGIRQHTFDFLRGDSGIKLPVDAFYSSRNLVIEFHEVQHTNEVKFFDNRSTISGVSRGEQRKIYDQRRIDLLPKNGVRLIVLSYIEFNHSSNGKLLRKIDEDRVILSRILSRFL